MSAIGGGDGHGDLDAAAALQLAPASFGRLEREERRVDAVLRGELLDERLTLREKVVD